MRAQLAISLDQIHAPEHLLGAAGRVDSNFQGVLALRESGGTNRRSIWTTRTVD